MQYPSNYLKCSKLGSCNGQKQPFKGNRVMLNCYEVVFVSQSINVTEIKFLI